MPPVPAARAQRPLKRWPPTWAKGDSSFRADTPAIVRSAVAQAAPPPHVLPGPPGPWRHRAGPPLSLWRREGRGSGSYRPEGACQSIPWGEGVRGRSLSARFALSHQTGRRFVGLVAPWRKIRGVDGPGGARGWALRSSALRSWSPSLLRGHWETTLTQLALCYGCWSRRCYPTRTRPSACSSRIKYPSRPS